MIIKELKKYQPQDEFEVNDKKIMLMAYQIFEEELLKRFPFFHFTVSAVIFDEKYQKVLFMFHNIYKSYSWVGGHMDGSRDLKKTIIKEVFEETGLKDVAFIKEEPVSIEILPVLRHYKNGEPISNHEHYNITYALKASTLEKTTINYDEGKDLKWLNISDLKKYVTEAEMLPIYKKIIERVKNEKINYF